MKIYNKIAAIVMVVFTMTSCAEDYLEVSPENVISEDNLDLEQLVVSAYSTLDYRYNTGEFRDNWPFDHAPTNWCFSDIRSGDATKVAVVLAITQEAECML